MWFFVRRVLLLFVLVTAMYIIYTAMDHIITYVIEVFNNLFVCHYLLSQSQILL